ncbi:putative phage related protein [Brochothrix thermosphacta]|uniref:hypothetical protein n=1 Tax=Brochothrix thermosphacta TaxID=2756 RepID=UPI000D7783D8|nr:hypothetical protein [Brochothrix thermosphacta]SPN72446.1 putative phage related protein [Brochothrix thermosphacta]
MDNRVGINIFNKFREEVKEMDDGLVVKTRFLSEKMIKISISKNEECLLICSDGGDNDFSMINRYAALKKYGNADKLMDKIHKLSYELYKNVTGYQKYTYRKAWLDSHEKLAVSYLNHNINDDTIFHHFSENCLTIKTHFTRTEYADLVGKFDIPDGYHIEEEVK